MSDLPNNKVEEAKGLADVINQFEHGPNFLYVYAVVILGKKKQAELEELGVTSLALMKATFLSAKLSRIITTNRFKVEVQKSGLDQSSIDSLVSMADEVLNKLSKEG